MASVGNTSGAQATNAMFSVADNNAGGSSLPLVHANVQGSTLGDTEAAKSTNMSNRFQCSERLRISPLVILIAVLATAPLTAQIAVESEGISARFGIQGQLWADWSQDATATVPGYTQNLDLRRARLMAGGEIGKDLTFFVQTDSPNLGKTPKSPAAGFSLQDAFLEWTASTPLRIDGGLFLVPLSRNTMQSTVSYYTVDISPLTTINNSATQSAGLRDLGFGARGFFAKNKLLYRFGVFQGERDSDGRNSLRTSGYVQYDFRDEETGYTFVGTALGKQKILAVDAGFDAQGSYHSSSANVVIDQPVFGGDELAGQFQFFHYNGNEKFPLIREQNDWFVEGAYYTHKLKLQPFGKFDDAELRCLCRRRQQHSSLGGGLNCYIHGQNLKWTLQFTRALPPSGSKLHESNEITMQLQVFYF
jgi:Phosphate-selective porin O and P